MPAARPARRPTWRVLAAILQIVAFVAFAMPGQGHAYTGHAHTGHARSGPAQIVHAHGDADHGTLGAAAHRHDDSAGAALLPDDADRHPSSSPCCPSCCSCSCHVFAGPVGPALPFGWAGARAAPFAPDAAYADVTPEAPPEPPRPFA